MIDRKKNSIVIKFDNNFRDFSHVKIIQFFFKKKSLTKLKWKIFCMKNEKYEEKNCKSKIDQNSFNFADWIISA